MKDSLKNMIIREMQALHKSGKTYSDIADEIDHDEITKDVIGHLCRDGHCSDDKAVILYYYLFPQDDEKSPIKKYERNKSLPSNVVPVKSDDALVFEDVAPLKTHLTVGITEDASKCLENIKLHTDLSYRDIASKLIIYAAKHIIWKGKGAD